MPSRRPKNSQLTALRRSTALAPSDDPLIALMTERDRLWEEAGNVDPVDGDKVLRAETLKEQIIGMVASSGEVLVMLVQYRRDSNAALC